MMPYNIYETVMLPMLRASQKVVLYAQQDNQRTTMAFNAKSYGGSKPVAFAEGLKSAPQGI